MLFRSKDYVIYLSLEEQETLINTIKYGTGLPPKQLKNTEKKSKRDLAIVFLFLDTGLRLSELQGLDVGDIDLDRCCATGVRELSLHWEYRLVIKYMAVLR